jgi:hypothetical protein
MAIGGREQNSQQAKSALIESAFLFLFLRYSHKDISIPDLDGVGRDVHHRGHGNRLSCPNVKLRTVTGANDIEAFHVPISQRAFIMRAYIANGEELSCNVEDDNRLVANLDKQPLATGKLGSGGNFHKLSFGFVKCCVIKHHPYSTSESLASFIP